MRAVARESYAVTLWTWAHIVLEERTRTFHRRSQAIESAGLNAAAFHEPKRLTEYGTRLRDEAGLSPSFEESVAESRKGAQGIIDFMKLYDAREAKTK